jgi:lipopolysaccharide transport system ATP-binding protein
MKTVISFKNVYKSYPFYHHITGGFKHFLFNFPKAMKMMKNAKHNAIQGISFDIKQGETVGFIGRNGAGKSTILGLIAGVLKANEGEVITNGRISPLLELGGGFHPELTGRANIKLNGVLLGLTRKQVEEKIDEIIEFSELGQFIDHPIRTYSSGMMARLGFSVIAHLDPQILLVDEVLAVGDASFQAKCIKKIHDFKEKGVTIILVSHSVGQVEEVCQRAIWIDKHKVKMDGPSSEVVKAYMDSI